MDAQRRFWDNFRRIARTHWPKVLTSTGVPALLLTTLWLTLVIEPGGGVVKWVNSMLMEIGAGFLEDWLQKRVRSGREPSFDDVWEEVKRMREEEREILERLAIKLNVLPVLLDEIAARHAAVVTDEMRQGFRQCEDHISHLKTECLHRLIEHLRAEQQRNQAWQARILMELEWLKGTIASYRTRHDRPVRRIIDEVFRAVEAEIKGTLDDAMT